MQLDLGPGFDLVEFLGRPLVARLATCGRHGPRVRPIWYLFDQEGFWWITGQWSRLEAILRADPRVELVVDTCDLQQGTVLQVRARGRAQLRPFDRERAQAWGERYMGPDRNCWGRFPARCSRIPPRSSCCCSPTGYGAATSAGNPKVRLPLDTITSWTARTAQVDAGLSPGLNATRDGGGA
jgi:hypothetical protein